MKRTLPLVLAAVGLMLIGKYAFPGTTINGDRVVSGTLTLNSQTASQALFTDASKNVVSNAISGSGNVCMSTSCVMTTPNLGTPSAGTATNLTGLPCTTGISTALGCQIATTTLGAPAASVTFNSLGSYKSLELIMQAACSSATANQGVGVQVNSDSAGTNYSRQFTLVTNATTQVGQNNSTTPSGAPPLVIACASSLANTSGVAQFIIPNYAGTTFTKQGFSVGGWFQNTTVTGQAIGSIAWQWNSTAAITSLILAPADGSNFITGSTFQIYGLQ